MRHVSIKLLRVFVLFMEYRDLQTVAAWAQVRPPTVAYSLSRLRDITRDPLFVNRSGTLEPTPFAVKLERAARQILDKWMEVAQPRDAREIGADAGRRVFVGFSPSIGDPVITYILTALYENFPGHSFSACSVTAHPAIHKTFEAGELHCAFMVDGVDMQDSVVPLNIMATPRRLVSADRCRENGLAGRDWILLQEDCESSSPLRAFLMRHVSHCRETVVPSWQSQISLMHSAGGICPILDFNVPLVTSDGKTLVLEPPADFPTWATVHFLMPRDAPDDVPLRDIMEVGASVLRDPPKAVESGRRARASAHLVPVV